MLKDGLGLCSEFLYKEKTSVGGKITAAEIYFDLPIAFQ